jgi:hypothetical protein
MEWGGSCVCKVGGANEVLQESEANVVFVGDGEDDDVIIKRCRPGSKWYTWDGENNRTVVSRECAD